MPKFHITASVRNVQGHQLWELEADNKRDALEKFEDGEGNVIHEELEVCALDDVTINDVEEVKE